MPFNTQKETAIKRGAVRTRDPFNCLPATYTDNIYKAAQSTSKLFREKIEEDLRKAGVK